MNTRLRADYNGTRADWQQGFSLVHVDDIHVRIETISISGGKLSSARVWEGWAGD